MMSAPEIIQRKLRNSFWWGIGWCLIFASVFLLFPEADIIVSELFYKPELSDIARGFWLADSKPLRLFFKGVDVASRVILISLFISVMWLAFRKSKKVIGTTYVCLSLILGPILVVNGVFKDHWDRARPRDIIEFGGTQTFTPAWIPSDQCKKNCSFTSGHAAAGFSFIVVHFLSVYRVWFWLSLAIGGLIGFTRIAVGAHFLSDVVFSFFLTYFIAAMLATCFVKFFPKRFP